MVIEGAIKGRLKSGVLWGEMED